MSINLRWSEKVGVALLIVVTLLPFGAFAQFKDQHSVESLVAVLKSPISSQSIKEARDFDDKIMSEGQIEGGSIYLVTDERSTLVNNLVRKLLAAMGQDAQQWVVRVLDTNPPIANAFVTGGKYIYVFTGLIKQAATEDELAFVLSHELGHSLLKHKERRKEDVTTTIGSIAVLAALLSKKHKEDYVDFAKIVMASYSRGDEEEADAIAVAISRRAGYDPLRGADFFSRGKQQQDTVRKENQHLLAKMRQGVQQARVLCLRWTQQYNSSWQYQSNENTNRVNAVCRDTENKRLAYNQVLQQYNMASLQEQRDVFFRTHPQDQSRIAAIVALTDYVYARRDLASISKYEQSYRVMLALQQVDSILFKSPVPSAPSQISFQKESASNTVQSQRPFSMDEVMARMGKGDFKTDSSISIVAPDTAENGAVVPFSVNVSSPIGVGERLIVIVNDRYPAYLATPLKSAYISQLSGRVKMTSGSGTIRAVVMDSKGELKSSTKSLNVIVGVQSFDNGETAHTSPTFKQRSIESSGMTEIKLLIDYPSTPTSFIKSVTSEFSDGAVVISLTPVASKNPFVSFKSNRPENPSYRVTVTDNRGNATTSEGRAY